MGKSSSHCARVRAFLAAVEDATIGDICKGIGLPRYNAREAVRWLSNTKEVLVRDASVPYATRRWFLNPDGPDLRDKEERWAACESALDTWAGKQPRYRLCERFQWAELPDPCNDSLATEAAMV